MKSISRIFVVLLAILIVACANDKAIKRDPYYGWSADKLFSIGEKSLARGEYESAARYFESLESQYPYGQYSEQGMLDHMYALYRSGDGIGVVSVSDRYIHLYPRSDRVDYAYYMRGVANFDQEHGRLAKYLPVDPALRDPGTSVKAYEDFASFLRQFPNSRYVSDVRQRMIYLRNLFAQKELYAAQFYMERKAYVAAANRASLVIENYNQSPQAREALKILADANHALGLHKEAEDAKLVLIKN